jgi:hypothetical protein
METPIVRNGTDSDGETGTWTTQATTARQSNLSNSTISWTGTFSSFGLDCQSPSSGVLPWSVDGGAETNYTLSTAGNKDFFASFDRGCTQHHDQGCERDGASQPLPGDLRSLWLIQVNILLFTPYAPNLYAFLALPRSRKFVLVKVC